jgi:hypothetical protein
MQIESRHECFARHYLWQWIQYVHFINNAHALITTQLSVPLSFPLLSLLDQDFGSIQPLAHSPSGVQLLLYDRPFELLSHAQPVSREIVRDDLNWAEPRMCGQYLFPVM